MACWKKYPMDGSSTNEAAGKLRNFPAAFFCIHTWGYWCWQVQLVSERGFSPKNLDDWPKSSWSYEATSRELRPGFSTFFGAGHQTRGVRCLELLHDFTWHGATTAPGASREVPAPVVSGGEDGGVKLWPLVEVERNRCSVEVGQWFFYGDQKMGMDCSLIFGSWGGDLKKCGE